MFACKGNAATMHKEELSSDTVSACLYKICEGDTFCVSKSIDLKGAVCCLPKNVVVKIGKGVLKNGTLIGSNTRIEGNGLLFDHVEIGGTWNVPQISTDFFTDLSYVNALKNVLALTNERVFNKVTIAEGDYIVSAGRNADVCLIINSNTDVEFRGTIQLIPNKFPRYDMIRINGRNITIKGNGLIIGDKNTHTGKNGEWGMGIRFNSAKNAFISGLTIKDCWGDCIYVGGNSSNVLIEKCTLDNGRRQGISVTDANDVVIRNCKISNVKGINPQYGIDLEPNAGHAVNHIVIENVDVMNCEGGILATIGKKNVETKQIGDVIIKKCNVSSNCKYPIRLKGCEFATIDSCRIQTTTSLPAVNLENALKVVLINNIIEVKRNSQIYPSQTRSKNIQKKYALPIEVINSKLEETGNRVIVVD